MKFLNAFAGWGQGHWARRLAGGRTAEPRRPTILARHARPGCKDNAQPAHPFSKNLRKLTTRATLLTGLLLWASLTSARPALAALEKQGQTGEVSPGMYYVDTFEDDITLSTCSTEGSDCSLRGAVEKANGVYGLNTIYLPAGVYVLRGGKEEDKNQTGDLDALQTGGSLTVIGEGAGNTRIRTEERTGTDRLFDVPDFASLTTLTLRNLTLQNGNAGNFDPGGAVRSFGSLTLENVVLDGNSAREGGGVYFYNPYSSSLVIKNCTFVNNWALTDGGGVFFWGGQAEITGSMFLNNRSQAETSEGTFNPVMSQGRGGAPSFISSYLRAEERGGAIFNNGQLTVTTSTFAQNIALKGGALANNAFAGASAKLNNVTFWGNTSAIYNIPHPGAALLGTQYSPPLRVSNTILADSTLGDNCISEEKGGENFVRDLGNNIDSSGGCRLTQKNSLSNTDPRLGFPQDNGGATDTLALQSDSPAIDGGSPETCTFRDQRGLSAVGVCDVGAFEFDARPYLRAVSGAMGGVKIGATPASQLNVYLSNGYGNALRDWRVNYDAGAANIVLSPASTETDTSGLASSAAALLDMYGEYTVTATAGSQSVRFKVSRYGASAINHASGGGYLPITGFTPGVRTWLPAQPVQRSYFSLISSASPRAESDAVRLGIPALGVEVVITGTPQLEDGSWDTTWLGEQAGWLEGTAFPTWKGNSGLAAHAALSSGLPGPFARLAELAWGDTLIIHAWGEKYIYTVRSVETVSPQDVGVLEHEDEAWLTLITCQGYDPAAGGYTERLVVRAVLLRVE